MTHGSCGFVLPLAPSIVYINITKGDYFGEVDFIFPALDMDLEIHEMIDQINKTSNTFNLIRNFSV